jgi:DDE superfamily endonuclease
VAVAAIVPYPDPVVGSDNADLRLLTGFRSGWHQCLTRWSDTLFEVGDALLCAPGPVPSLPYLSLEPACRRGWGSVYAALADGDVDAERARDLLAGYLPHQWWPVLAVDVTAWPRPDAACSPRRGMCRVPDPGGDPRGRAVPGWAYQWICQVSPARDSWTAPADLVRNDPDDVANEVAALQMRALATRLARHRPGVVPRFCLDAGYCPITATLAVAHDPQYPARVIVRIRRDRVFYSDPPPRPAGTAGRPRLHGTRFACKDPSTWPAPTHEMSTTDDQYGHIHLQAWTGLHPRPAKKRR